MSDRLDAIRERMLRWGECAYLPGIEGHYAPDIEYLLDRLTEAEAKWEKYRDEAHILTVERDEAVARPCPHIVTSDEGTSYCDLAESFDPMTHPYGMTEEEDNY